MRKRWVLAEKDGKPALVPAEEYYRDKQVKRVHNVIADEIHGGLWNPADDKIYSSKRNFDKAVKAAGCVIKGNERVKPRQSVNTSREWESAIVDACEIHKVRF